MPANRHDRSPIGHLRIGQARGVHRVDHQHRGGHCCCGRQCHRWGTESRAVGGVLLHAVDRNPGKPLVDARAVHGIKNEGRRRGCGCVAVVPGANIQCRAGNVSIQHRGIVCEKFPNEGLVALQFQQATVGAVAVERNRLRGHAIGGESCNLVDHYRHVEKKRRAHERQARVPLGNAKAVNDQMTALALLYRVVVDDWLRGWALTQCGIEGAQRVTHEGNFERLNLEALSVTNWCFATRKQDIHRIDWRFHDVRHVDLGAEHPTAFDVGACGVQDSGGRKRSACGFLWNPNHIGISALAYCPLVARCNCWFYKSHINLCRGFE